MRILVYGINYAPEITGIGKYTGEMCEWLAARGHAVKVVTAPPYYPAWRVAEGYRSYWYEREEIEGAQIWRCPLYVPKKPSGLKRLAHLSSFAGSSLPVALSQGMLWRPDVVFCVAPALFCAPGAWLAAKAAGAKCWLHLQDFELDAAFELGLLPQGGIRNLAENVERVLLRRFDRVSTISNRMQEGLIRKGVSPQRTQLFPNWVDVDRICPNRADPSLRMAFGIAPDKFVVLYSGNMGEKQGLEIVIHAARKLQHNPRIQLVLCGDGAARERLQQSATGLTNLIFAPLQPFDRLNALLNMADVHLLPQRPDAADLVMPSKLTSILACGGAVVATAARGTEVATVVTVAGGAVTDPGNTDQFATMIERLASDPDACEQMRRTTRAYAVEHLGTESILRSLERELYTLIDAPVPAPPISLPHIKRAG